MMDSEGSMPNIQTLKERKIGEFRVRHISCATVTISYQSLLQYGLVNHIHQCPEGVVLRGPMHLDGDGDELVAPTAYLAYVRLTA